LVWLVAVLAACAVTGCDSASKKKVTVRGKVTWQNKPAAGGLIRFVPSEGKGSAADAEIKDDGQYEVSVAPGSYKIEITWNKMTETTEREYGTAGELKKKSDPQIPSKYNVESKMVKEIENKDTEINFDLPGKD